MNKKIVWDMIVFSIKNGDFWLEKIVIIIEGSNFDINKYMI